MHTHTHTHTHTQGKRGRNKDFLLPLLVKQFHLAWAGTVSDLQDGSESDGGRIRQIRKQRGRRSCQGTGGGGGLQGLLSLAPLNIFPPLWSNVCTYLTRLPAPAQMKCVSRSTHPFPSHEDEVTSWVLSCVSECRWQALWSPVSLSCRCPLSGLRWDTRGLWAKCGASTCWEWSPAPADLGRSQTRLSQLALHLYYFIPLKKGNSLNVPFDEMESSCFGGMLL